MTVVHGYLFPRLLYIKGAVSRHQGYPDDVLMQLINHYN